MSWIRSRCGERISDNTDLISCKGYIISDREFYGIHEMAAELIKSDESDRRKLVFAFYDNIGYEDEHIRVGDIFQCTEC